MAGEQRIVITSDDLDAPARRPPPPLPSPPSALPPLPAQAPRIGVGTGPGWSTLPARSPLAALGANTIVSGLVAGVLGGALGMVLAEVLRNPDKQTIDFSQSVSAIENQFRINSGIHLMIFAAVLGLVVHAWDGITSGSAGKAGRDGAIGLGIGLATGFLGGYVAQWIYSGLLPDDAFGADENAFRLARTVGWSVMGGLLGMGLGVRGGPKRILYGLIGGLVGGAVGGLIFHQIEFSADATSSGFTVRLLGFTATGVGVALGVGLVERLLRDAWLQVTAGPMTGKEFILYKDATTVGSAPKCDIVLVKDGAVAAHHLTFVRDARGAVGVQPAAGAPVQVNGAATGGQALRSGDQVSLGQSTFLIRDRAG